MKYLFFFCIFVIFTNKLQAYELKIEKVVDLEKPWSLSFVDKNKIIVTEISGKIKLININNKSVKDIDHNLNILVYGQGGLLDILFSKKNVWVSYSENMGNWKSTTSIAKGEYSEKKIYFKNIFSAKPAIDSGYHFGSRLLIKDKFLFATIGERGQGMIAQDGNKHPGSVIRIFKDGTIPKDNPHYLDKKDWLPEIFQIGVRNPQGLTLSPIDNKIYMSNHGARGGDWFGEVKKGENYGWKVLGWGGTNYDFTKIGPKWKPGYTKAIKYWVPSIATSAITIYKGKEFPDWNGHALVTSLKDMSLRKLDFENKSENEVIEEIVFKGKIGRIRDIKIEPISGKLFLLSNKGLWKMEKVK